MAESTPVPTPTQVKRPWRATARTVLQGLLGFLALLPFIVRDSGLDPEVYPWLGGILAVAAVVTRVMALPQVEAFLQKYVPFLAATPRQRAAYRNEGGYVDGLTLLVVVLVVVVLVVVLL